MLPSTIKCWQTVSLSPHFSLFKSMNKSRFTYRFLSFGALLILLQLLVNPSNGHGQTMGLMQHDSLLYEAYTLFSPTESTYLIDNCGHLINEWTCDTRPGLSAYLLENGQLLRTGRMVSEVFSGGGNGGLLSLWDWDSNMLWGITISNDTIHSHHDVEPLPSGNVLVICWEYMTEEEAIQAGRDPDNIDGAMWTTVVLELEPVGTNEANLVWQWRIWEHLIQDFDSTKDNYGVVSEHPELLDINFDLGEDAGPIHKDWLHCNAVTYNAEFDQIMISAREANEVFVIDHSASTVEITGHTGGAHGRGGDLIYRFGNPQNYDRGTEDDRKLFLQHDCRWVKDGYPGEGGITVFNNLGGQTESHVDLFYPPMDSLGFYDDPGTEAYGPSEFGWHYEAPMFFSHNISGAQRLANGNTLICEGAEGRFFEVTEEGVQVWEYINPVGFFGPLQQGQAPTQNPCFRANKYELDFPGFAGHDLTPGAPIELMPLDYECAPFATDTTEIKDTVITAIEINSLLLNEGRILTIYPNPFSDILHIESTLSETRIDILDLHGRLVYTGRGSQAIDTMPWPSGLYLLRTKDNNQTTTKKIIKL
jgi:hypothetical protein